MCISTCKQFTMPCSISPFPLKPEYWLLWYGVNIPLSKIMPPTLIEHLLLAGKVSRWLKQGQIQGRLWTTVTLPTCRKGLRTCRFPDLNLVGCHQVSFFIDSKLTILIPLTYRGHMNKMQYFRNEVLIFPFRFEYLLSPRLN